jgi:hypothetical protein
MHVCDSDAAVCFPSPPSPRLVSPSVICKAAVVGAGPLMSKSPSPVAQGVLRYYKDAWPRLQTVLGQWDGLARPPRTATALDQLTQYPSAALSLAVALAKAALDVAQLVKDIDYLKEEFTFLPASVDTWSTAEEQRMQVCVSEILPAPFLAATFNLVLLDEPDSIVALYPVCWYAHIVRKLMASKHFLQLQANYKVGPLFEAIKNEDYLRKSLKPAPPNEAIKSPLKFPHYIGQDIKKDLRSLLSSSRTLRNFLTWLEAALAESLAREEKEEELLDFETRERNKAQRAMKQLEEALVVQIDDMRRQQTDFQAQQTQARQQEAREMEAFRKTQQDQMKLFIDEHRQQFAVEHQEHDALLQTKSHAFEQQLQANLAAQRAEAQQSVVTDLKAFEVAHQARIEVLIEKETARQTAKLLQSSTRTFTPEQQAEIMRLLHEEGDKCCWVGTKSVWTLVIAILALLMAIAALAIAASRT